MEPAESGREYLFVRTSPTERTHFEQAVAAGYRLVRSAALPKTLILEKAAGSTQGRAYEYLAAQDEAALQECVGHAESNGFRPVHSLVEIPMLPNGCGRPAAGSPPQWGVLMER